jgi:predicted glycosyltransferase involved in capsule biosynthesis
VAIAAVITLPLANAHYAQKCKYHTGVLWFFIALISSAVLANMFQVFMLENGYPEASAGFGFIVITTIINIIIFIFSLPNKNKVHNVN